ncbi:hypothetical protein PS6_009488 [Mucor atramentarius]
MKKSCMPSSTLPALSLTNLQHQEWPLEEYQEKRIMNALSQQQLLSPFLDEEYSDDDDTVEEDDVNSISPTTSYFSDPKYYHSSAISIKFLEMFNMSTTISFSRQLV